MRMYNLSKQVVLFFVILVAGGCGPTDHKAVKFGTSEVDALYTQAQTLVKEGRLWDAKMIYAQITDEHADFKDIEKVQQEMYQLNMKILFSNIQTPHTIVHEVVIGDTLGKISKQYNVTIDLIKASNNIQGEIIRVGQKLRIWTGKFSVYVSKSQNFLMLKSNEEILKIYNVSTGANNSTPVGTFKVTTKLENPVWFKAGAVIPPESPDNVLGTRWLGFDKEGYGIHGTVEPDKIGQQVTAGCVRMRNEDVEELYKIVPRGVEVTVVD